MTLEEWLALLGMVGTGLECLCLSTVIVVAACILSSRLSRGEESRGGNT